MLNKLTSQIRRIWGRKAMPYITHSWNGYEIKVLPTDLVRRLANKIRWIYMPPYYAGYEILFDIVVTPPNKSIKAEKLKYEWSLYDSQDKPIPNTNELMSIGDSTITFQKYFPLYPVSGDIYRHIGNSFRKIHGVHLGLLTKIGSYSLKLRLSNSSGSSEYLTCVVFDIQSWEAFKREIYSSIFAGVIGGVLVAIILELIKRGD